MPLAPGRGGDNSPVTTEMVEELANLPFVGRVMESSQDHILSITLCQRHQGQKREGTPGSLQAVIWKTDTSRDQLCPTNLRRNLLNAVAYQGSGKGHQDSSFDGYIVYLPTCKVKTGVADRAVGQLK